MNAYNNLMNRIITKTFSENDKTIKFKYNFILLII